MNYILRKLKFLDFPLLIVSVLVALIGLSLLYAMGFASSNLQLFYKQLAFNFVGIGFSLFLSMYNYQRFTKLARIGYVAFLIILLSLFVFGDPVKGSTRWLDFWIFRFQPAEFVKLLVVLVLSRFFYLRRGEINSWKVIILSAILAAVPACMVLLQPDLGTSLVILATWFGMMMVTSIRTKYIAYLLLIFIMMAAASWFVVLKPYQKTRIEVFLDPGLDPKGKGYNVRQAIIATGSGGVFGRGLGRGLQSSLKFLPERYTDFMFASISEEVGFVGSFSIVSLWIFLLWRLMYLARNAASDLGTYIIFGAFFVFFVQLVINVGMNIGVMPVTGIPLPLISYGGSSAMVTWLLIGVVQNVVVQSRVSKV